jgi:hypothetical protein
MQVIIAPRGVVGMQVGLRTLIFRIKHIGQIEAAAFMSSFGLG